MARDLGVGGGRCSPGVRPGSRTGGASTSGGSVTSRGSMDETQSRFPLLKECAHFHYDIVELGKLQLSLEDVYDASSSNVTSTQGFMTSSHNTHYSDVTGFSTSDNTCVKQSTSSYDHHVSSFVTSSSLEVRGPTGQQITAQNNEAENPSEEKFGVRVTSRDRAWIIYRLYRDFCSLDVQLHRCVYDRRYSMLPELSTINIQSAVARRKLLSSYLTRLSSIACSLINCGPVLTWMEMDNRGNRLVAPDDNSVMNVPAVGAAHVVRRYVPQAPDELPLEVGDIVSLLSMPAPRESTWWQGKKAFEAGFFPSECVELIGDSIPPSLSDKTPAKPVLRRRGKLITRLKQFFTTRPSRSLLKQSGIVRERVFGCDLGEHLLNSNQQVPVILTVCTQAIETAGIVDGIYRLSGVASTIQRLRNEFDAGDIPELSEDLLCQDIHSVSSLLKMYFRDLPNPLLTYQLYDKFEEAMNEEESERLNKVYDIVQQLPPPHYRTAAFLMKHLCRMASHSSKTNMHCKNLAIVWAPNLLKSKTLEQTECSSSAVLTGVCMQAIVVEYLIMYADVIFTDHSTLGRRGHRPVSMISVPLGVGGSGSAKLLSIEEARKRALIASPRQRFIDVGGGPGALPHEYHTVIPRSKKRGRGSGERKLSLGWRSMFTRRRAASCRSVDDGDGRSISTTSESSTANKENGTASEKYSRNQSLQLLTSSANQSREILSSANHSPDIYASFSNRNDEVRSSKRPCLRTFKSMDSLVKNNQTHPVPENTLQCHKAGDAVTPPPVLDSSKSPDRESVNFNLMFGKGQRLPSIAGNKKRYRASTRMSDFFIDSIGFQDFINNDPAVRERERAMLKPNKCSPDVYVRKNGDFIKERSLSEEKKFENERQNENLSQMCKSVSGELMNGLNQISAGSTDINLRVTDSNLPLAGAGLLSGDFCSSTQVKNVYEGQRKKNVRQSQIGTCLSDDEIFTNQYPGDKKAVNEDNWAGYSTMMSGSLSDSGLDTERYYNYRAIDNMISFKSKKTVVSHEGLYSSDKCSNEVDKVLPYLNGAKSGCSNDEGISSDSGNVDGAVSSVLGCSSEQLSEQTNEQHLKSCEIGCGAITHDYSTVMYTDSGDSITTNSIYSSQNAPSFIPASNSMFIENQDPVNRDWVNDLSIELCRAENCVEVECRYNDVNNERLESSIDSDVFYCDDKQTEQCVISNQRTLPAPPTDDHWMQIQPNVISGSIAPNLSPNRISDRATIPRLHVTQPISFSTLDRNVSQRPSIARSVSPNSGYTRQPLSSSNSLWSAVTDDDDLRSWDDCDVHAGRHEAKGIKQNYPAPDDIRSWAESVNSQQGAELMKQSYPIRERQEDVWCKIDSNRKMEDGEVAKGKSSDMLDRLPLFIKTLPGSPRYSTKRRIHSIDFDADESQGSDVYERRSVVYPTSMYDHSSNERTRTRSAKSLHNVVYVPPNAGKENRLSGCARSCDHVTDQSDEGFVYSPYEGRYAERVKLNVRQDPLVQRKNSGDSTASGRSRVIPCDIPSVPPNKINQPLPMFIGSAPRTVSQPYHSHPVGSLPTSMRSYSSDSSNVRHVVYSETDSATRSVIEAYCPHDMLTSRGVSEGYGNRGRETSWADEMGKSWHSATGCTDSKIEFDRSNSNVGNSFKGSYHDKVKSVESSVDSKRNNADVMSNFSAGNTYDGHSYKQVSTTIDTYHDPRGQKSSGRVSISSGETDASCNIITNMDKLNQKRFSESYTMPIKIDVDLSRRSTGPLSNRCDKIHPGVAVEIPATVSCATSRTITTTSGKGPTSTGRTRSSISSTKKEAMRYPIPVQHSVTEPVPAPRSSLRSDPEASRSSLRSDPEASRSSLRSDAEASRSSLRSDAEASRSSLRSDAEAPRSSLRSEEEPKAAPRAVKLGSICQSEAVPAGREVLYSSPSAFSVQEQSRFESWSLEQNVQDHHFSTAHTDCSTNIVTGISSNNKDTSILKQSMEHKQCASVPESVRSESTDKSMEDSVTSTSLHHQMSEDGVTSSQVSGLFSGSVANSVDTERSECKSVSPPRAIFREKSTKIERSPVKNTREELRVDGGSVVSEESIYRTDFSSFAGSVTEEENKNWSNNKAEEFSVQSGLMSSALREVDQSNELFKVSPNEAENFNRNGAFAITTTESRNEDFILNKKQNINESECVMTMTNAESKNKDFSVRPVADTDSYNTPKECIDERISDHRSSDSKHEEVHSKTDHEDASVVENVVQIEVKNETRNDTIESSIVTEVPPDEDVSSEGDSDFEYVYLDSSSLPVATHNPNVTDADVTNDRLGTSIVDPINRSDNLLVSCENSENVDLTECMAEIKQNDDSVFVSEEQKSTVCDMKRNNEDTAEMNVTLSLESGTLHKERVCESLTENRQMELKEVVDKGNDSISEEAVKLEDQSAEINSTTSIDKHTDDASTSCKLAEVSDSNSWKRKRDIYSMVGNDRQSFEAFNKTFCQSIDQSPEQEQGKGSVKSFEDSEAIERLGSEVCEDVSGEEMMKKTLSSVGLGQVNIDNSVIDQAIKESVSGGELEQNVTCLKSNDIVSSDDREIVDSASCVDALKETSIHLDVAQGSVSVSDNVSDVVKDSNRSVEQCKAEDLTCALSVDVSDSIQNIDVDVSEPNFCTEDISGDSDDKKFVDRIESKENEKLLSEQTEQNTAPLLKLSSDKLLVTSDFSVTSGLESHASDESSVKISSISDDLSEARATQQNAAVDFSSSSAILNIQGDSDKFDSVSASVSHDITTAPTTTHPAATAATGNSADTAADIPAASVTAVDAPSTVNAAATAAAGSVMKKGPPTARKPAVNRASTSPVPSSISPRSKTVLASQSISTETNSSLLKKKDSDITLKKKVESVVSEKDKPARKSDNSPKSVESKTVQSKSHVTAEITGDSKKKERICGTMNTVSSTSAVDSHTNLDSSISSRQIKEKSPADKESSAATKSPGSGTTARPSRTPPMTKPKSRSNSTERIKVLSVAPADKNSDSIPSDETGQGVASKKVLPSTKGISSKDLNLSSQSDSLTKTTSYRNSAPKSQCLVSTNNVEKLKLVSSSDLKTDEKFSSECQEKKESSPSSVDNTSESVTNSSRDTEVFKPERGSSPQTLGRVRGLSKMFDAQMQ